MGVKGNRGNGVEVVKLSNLRAAKQDGSRFTKEQRELLRAHIAEDRLRGMTFPDIAAKHDIALSYAYSEYKVVEQRWRANANASLAQAKQQELARIDLVEKTAWEAFERSMSDETEYSNQYSPDGEGNPELASTKARKRGRDGDPRWLAIILNCVDRRTKLLGLNSADLKGPTTHVAVSAVSDNPEDRLAKYSGVFGFAIVAGEDATPDRARLGESLDSDRPAPEAGRVFDTTGRLRESTP